MNAKTAVLLIIAVWLPLIGASQEAAATEMQETQIYTLEATIAEAMKNNWDLKALEEKLTQAQEVKKQARADFLPRLKTSYSYTGLDEPSNYESSYGGNIAVSSRESFQWRSTVIQPIFAGFGLISAYRLAELGIDQSEMEIELNKLELALKVKEAYFNVLVMDKTVEVARKEAESLTSNAEMTRSFYNAGVVPVNDLLKAEMELADAQQKLVQAGNQAALARSALNILLARPVKAPVDLEDILVYTPEMAVFEDAIATALKNRVEIRLIDNEIQRSEQKIRLTQRGYYPEVNLAYDYIKEGDSADVSGSPYHDEKRWQLAVAASWTLWEWGKTHFAVRQGESAREELVKTRKSLEDNVRLDVREAMLYIATAEQNIPTTEKAVLQGEENLRVTQEGYRAQVNTVTEVLDAQALLTQARVNYYKAMYTHSLAKAQLLRAMGTY